MLKKLLGGFLLLSCGYSLTSLASIPISTCPDIQVCFTPGQNCTAEITEVIDAAKKSIFVQAYSLPLMSFWIKAKNRNDIAPRIF